MTSKLNRRTYEKLIREDLEWLLKQSRTLERDHIEQIIRASADHEYGSIVPENWVPTSDAINALPLPLRKYIHDIETRCDPGGDVQTIAVLRENVQALALKVQELEGAHENDKQLQEDQARPHSG